MKVIGKADYQVKEQRIDDGRQKTRDGDRRLVNWLTGELALPLDYTQGKLTLLPPSLSFFAKATKETVPEDKQDRYRTSTNTSGASREFRMMK